MMVHQDFIINKNGQLHGEGPAAKAIAGVRGDVGMARPYFGEDGYAYVTVNTGRKKKVIVRDKKTGTHKDTRYEPVYEEVRVKDLQDAGIQVSSIAANATSLTKDQWLRYDAATIPPQRERLRLYDDIARVETYSFPGLGIKILEHETRSKMGKAYWDMDGRSEGTDDTPLSQLEGVPIGVLHGHFSVDLRTLESSRRSGMPLSTLAISEVTRAIMDLREDLAIGIAGAAPLYGSSTNYGRTAGNYGLLNFPDRITKTDLTTPTGANPQAIFDDVLEMRDLMYAANHYGPFGIYHSTDYDRYLDAPYAYSDGSGWGIAPTQTLRQALLGIGTEGGMGGNNTNERQIRFVKRLDRLTPAASHAFTMIMVSLNGNVIRALNGMPVTVFQEELRAGWEIQFMVACINQIEMFADFYGNCGLIHARTA